MNHFPQDPVTEDELVGMSHAALLTLRLSVYDTEAYHSVECSDPACRTARYLEHLGSAVDTHLRASWCERLMPELVREAA